LFSNEVPLKKEPDDNDDDVTYIGTTQKRRRLSNGPIEFESGFMPYSRRRKSNLLTMEFEQCNGRTRAFNGINQFNFPEETEAERKERMRLRNNLNSKRR